jgi:hypothetical protein
MSTGWGMSGDSFPAPSSKIFPVPDLRHGGIFVLISIPTVPAEIHEYQISTKKIYFSVKIMIIV